MTINELEFIFKRQAARAGDKFSVQRENYMPANAISRAMLGQRIQNLCSAYGMIATLRNAGDSINVKIERIVK
ncbi:MAG: hypothetical protein G3W58_22875 [Pantoea ananatis]|nr:hypothetical protein [Pantoea ananatis]